MIQLRYGEDGLDGMWVENQQMLTMKPTNAVFESEFKVKNNAFYFRKFIQFEAIIKKIGTKRLSLMHGS